MIENTPWNRNKFKHYEVNIIYFTFWKPVLRLRVQSRTYRKYRKSPHYTTTDANHFSYKYLSRYCWHVLRKCRWYIWYIYIYIYITVIGLDNSNLTSTSFHNLLRYLISHVTQHQATRGQPKAVHAVLSPAPAKTVSDGKCSTCPA